MNGMLFHVLQSTVLSRLGGSLLGLGCIIGLIWYAGPLLGLRSPGLRLALIGAIVAVAVLVVFLRWAIARRRGGKLKRELDAQGGREAERAAEIEAIQQKMSEAIASLKASELGGGARGKAALYALPWYMIIGPSAAGKSTMLRHSGLHFPYASSEDLHLKGFGGTRNCDWWFSDQAILLDTAGRYTTEDDDREEWLTFLGLLRKHRPRMPINGVIVTLAVSELLTADSEALERHVKILRERISELMKELRMVFPVYVVFSKCDLLHGFEAFFEDLSEQERGQLWGAYLFEADAEDPAALFEARMRELYGKLCELRLRKLSMQRNHARKAALFDFPNQFAAATDKLVEFIHLLFKPNPYQETPRFAGVYFTSGTQEGTPLQRVVGNLRQAFGYAQGEEPRSGPVKSYFIRQLFTDVIFQLQSAVSRSRKRLVWQRACKSAVVAGALASWAGAFVLLSGAFATNSWLLHGGADRVERVAATLGAEEPQPRQALLALHELYGFYRKLLANERERPLLSRIGVYTAHQQIPAIEALLLSGVRSKVHAPALKTLEYRLENLARDWETADKGAREAMRPPYYHALQVYLISTGAGTGFDETLARPFYAELWREHAGGAGTPEQGLEGAELDELLAFYLPRAYGDDGRLLEWPLRTELVAQARGQLSTPPNAERLYAQLKSKGARAYPELSLDELLSARNRGALVAEQPLPGLYTAAAWHGFVREQLAAEIDKATRGDWVLGTAAGAEATVDEALAVELEAAVRHAYFRDYADAWLTFLGGIEPQSFRSLDHASQQLMQLSRSDGPVGELMTVVAGNVNLTELPLPKLSAASETPAQPPRVPELAEALADLSRFATASGEMSVSESTNQYLLSTAALKNEVERLALAVDVPREAHGYAATVLGNTGSSTQLYRSWVTATGLLNALDPRTRRALEGLLTRPVRDTWGHVLSQARTQVQREWRYNVARVYAERLARRFPFSEQGPDAALDDVAEFFRPHDGVLWSFVEQDLAPFLTERRGRYRERRWLGMGLGFSPRFFSALAGAEQITGSLFRHGGDRPEMDFYVYPVPVPGLSEMTLESNGQVYRYRNEPQEWRRFSWPGPMQHIGARVAGRVSRGAFQGELAASGQWGLFHLLRDARLSEEGGTVYLSEWKLEAEGYGPISVRFRIRADRAHSVFHEQLIKGFGLPETVFVAGGGETMMAEAR